MNIRSIFLSLTVASIAMNGNAMAGSITPSPHIVTGFSHPESVLIEGAHRYVSNIGAQLDPQGHDGDGFISELDESGAILSLRAFPSGGERLNAPKGMAMLDHILYVADIDRIVGFDTQTHRQIFETHIPGDDPAFLNDLSVMEDELIASDTVRGIVYRIDVTNGTFSPLADHIPGANGVVWDATGKRLLVVGLGASFEGGDFFEIPLGKTARKIEWGAHGLLDGLALLPDGSILLSDWLAITPPKPGVILQYGADGSSQTVFDPGQAIHGPADFSIDIQRNEVWIPATLNGSIVIAPLKP